LKQLTGKYGKQPNFVFKWVSRADANEIAAKFGLNAATTEPAVVIYNAKRSKYIVVDHFDAGSISVVLDRVIGGDASWTKL
jgi:hypothetical protein